MESLYTCSLIFCFLDDQVLIVIIIELLVFIVLIIFAVILLSGLILMKHRYVHIYVCCAFIEFHIISLDFEKLTTLSQQA